MPTCAARDCQSRTGQDGPKKTFHMFPKSRELRERWLCVTGRRNWVPGPRAVLCSDHFVEQCFDRTGQTTRLRTGAVPTLDKTNRRRKGRGGMMKLEPFYLPAIKQEPRDPSSYHQMASPKKRGPGRPRKHPPTPSVTLDEREEDLDDPPSAPQEDHPTHLDHYYCRNHHETQAIIHQKEKKAEYLRMKLQYLEGEARVKQEPPDWTQFRRATLLEEAEEVRRRLRLSGKTPATTGRIKTPAFTERIKTQAAEKTDGRRKVGRPELMVPKTESRPIQLVTGKTNLTPKKIKIITGNTEKIQVLSSKNEEMQVLSGKTEKIKVLSEKIEKIQVVTGKPEGVAGKIQIVTGRSERGVSGGKICVVSEGTEGGRDEIQLLVEGNMEMKKETDLWTSDKKLKQKEEEVNNLLKKIKTLQQRKRREKKRSKARFFRYFVMVEPTKKKRGRKKQVVSDGEEEEEEDVDDRDGEDDGEEEDDDDDDDDDEEEDEEEEEEGPISPSDLNPSASIQDSILSHTASLLVKQQRNSDFVQEKEKEIRELRRCLRLVQERERGQAEQIQHLQEVVSYLKSNPAEAHGSGGVEEMEEGDIVEAGKGRVEERETEEERMEEGETEEGRMEEGEAEEEEVEETVEWEGVTRGQRETERKTWCHEEVEGSYRNQNPMTPQRHCRLCLASLHQRCHKRPRNWSPSTLDSLSSVSFLPHSPTTVRRKARATFGPPDLPLCSDCRLALGKRKDSQVSLLTSLSHMC